MNLDKITRANVPFWDHGPDESERLIGAALPHLNFAAPCGAHRASPVAVATSTHLHRLQCKHDKNYNGGRRVTILRAQYRIWNGIIMDVVIYD